MTSAYEVPPSVERRRQKVRDREDLAYREMYANPDAQPTLSEWAERRALRRRDSRVFSVSLDALWRDLPACDQCGALAGEPCWNLTATVNVKHTDHPHWGRLEYGTKKEHYARLWLLSQRERWAMQALRHSDAGVREAALMLVAVLWHDNDLDRQSAAEQQLRELLGVDAPMAEPTPEDADGIPF